MKKRQKTKTNDKKYQNNAGLFLGTVKKSRKKIIASLLATAIVASCPTAAYANVKEVEPVVKEVQLFKDVPTTHWAQPYISKLQGSAAIEESYSGKFYPNSFISREDFTVMLMKALGKESDLLVGSYMQTAYEAGGHSYVDYVLGTFWDVWKYSESHPYIAAAYEDGIVKGVSKNYFNPKGVNTREEAAMIATNILKEYYNGEILMEEQNFIDSNEISSWAKEAVNIAVSNDIFSGMPDNSFDPQGTITKAQTATIVLKMVEKVKGIKLLQPEIDYLYKTVGERLEEAGAKYGEWTFKTGFEREAAPTNLDEVTARLAGIGPFENTGTVTIALPLTGNEEFGPWLTYLHEGETETSLRLADNGTFDELVEQGLFIAEFRENVVFDTKIIETRTKENIKIFPTWIRSTVQTREIENLKEVLDSDPDLVNYISYLQPIKDCFDGSDIQLEEIPEPYVLQKK